MSVLALFSPRALSRMPTLRPPLPTSTHQVMSTEPCDIWDCMMDSFEYGDQFMFAGLVAWGDKSGDEWPQSAPFLQVG